ncbi:MAG: ethanolamine ammonia-lyase reactivating factor EutA [Acidimicrobiales bacterium]
MSPTATATAPGPTPPAAMVVAGPPRAEPEHDSDVVELATVGIDIGSATYHLTISRVRLERRATELSTRYEVVAREVLASSPVLFTPYAAHGDLIDVDTVDAVVRRCYADAGVLPEDVDTGVVLLTGAALTRRNARPLADRLAGQSGKLVCAAAGHHFEAILAAHGSGAVARSLTEGCPVVAMDIGGATTKLAVVENGRVGATAALTAGGRLLAWEADGRLTRVEPAVVPLARELGIELEPGAPVDQSAIGALAGRMAQAIVHQLRPEVVPEASDVSLLLSDAFPAPDQPFVIVPSGGVAEYLGGGDASVVAPGEPGDLGPALARSVLSWLGRAGLIDSLRPATERIRATVVGASQFSTQVSGSTIRIGADSVLPLHNVPVVRPAIAMGGTLHAPAVAAAVRGALAGRFEGLDHPPAVALAVAWDGLPEHGRLRALADGIRAGTAGLAPGTVLVVAVDRDLAATLGRVMVEESGFDDRTIVCLDHLDLADLDHLDIARPVQPAHVVPVVVKSLLFGGPGLDATPGQAGGRRADRPQAGATVPSPRTPGGNP